MVSTVARARVTEAVVVRAVMLGHAVSRNIVSLGWWCGVLSCGVGGCRVGICCVEGSSVGGCHVEGCRASVNSVKAIVPGVWCWGWL